VERAETLRRVTREHDEAMRAAEAARAAAQRAAEEQYASALADAERTAQASADRAYEASSPQRKQRMKKHCARRRPQRKVLGQRADTIREAGLARAEAIRWPARHAPTRCARSRSHMTARCTTQRGPAPTVCSRHHATRTPRSARATERYETALQSVDTARPTVGAPADTDQDESDSAADRPRNRPSS